MAMLSFFALKFELDNWCWILVWGTILWQAETVALLDAEFGIEYMLLIDIDDWIRIYLLLSQHDYSERRNHV